MSITLDVNAFLNKDVCSTGCDDISIEKEVDSNIFDEIEHLLKFNKVSKELLVIRRAYMNKIFLLQNLEYESQQKEEEIRKTKPEESETNDTLNLDFLNSAPDDFLLTADSQSLLGEDLILYVVEQDRLQPVSSRFMVPGIYKRIEGVVRKDTTLEERKPNVFISDCEKQGRIVTQKEFKRLYLMAGEYGESLLSRVILLEPLESDDNNDENEHCIENENIKEKLARDKIPRDWDALNRLAYDILKLTNRDHIVIDRKRNEIVRTQFDTHQKTIYRFLSPDTLGLNPSPANDEKTLNFEKEETFQTKPIYMNKLGRPRKKLSEDKNPKKFKKINKKADSSEKPLITTNKMVSNANFRTRSGRIIKTTNSLQPNLLSLLPPPSPQETIKNLLNDLKDSDYQCSKINNVQKQSLDDTESISVIQESPQRKIPPEAICPTCKKIFLGRRLQRHFAQHPEHIQITQSAKNAVETISTNGAFQPSEDMSLFRFLISKLQKPQNLNEDQKADLFLNELNDLVKQLQLRSSRLIRNTSGLHFVNQRCSKLLGIPEGQYALDISAIESPIDPEITTLYNISSQNVHSQPNNISARSLDYTNLSITLDDTLTDEAAQKLNLSAGGKLLPPSEESLLRAVGDLVETNIDKIHGTSMLKQHPINNIGSLPSPSNPTAIVAKLLPPHIDHASDNAVEAVHMKETTTGVSPGDNRMLDLSVDFFQFNN